MTEIWVLGAPMTPEYVGGVADAKAMRNLVPFEGGAVYRKPEGDDMADVYWAFTSSGGPRAIYVRYASDRELPCKLIVNGKVAQRKALFEPTLGVPDWRYQVTLDLPAGDNMIGLRGQGEFPDIEAVAVVSPSEGEQPCVDDAYAALNAERRRSIPRRPLVLQPSRLAGLIDVAREVVADDAAYAQLGRVTSRMLVCARWDSESGFSRIAWGGGPMNGQRVRQHIFSRLMRMDVDAIVETGTYIGSSTSFFARQGVPVFSCELQEKFFARAAAHLVEHANVTLHLDDSRSFLRRLAADPAFQFERPLFYLDAHWQDDLPLADEIRIISARWKSFAIMVDDFQVPGTDYVYDSYASGLELTLGYLEREGVSLDEFAVLFPSAGPDLETGAKRGTLILMPQELYQQQMRMDRSVFRYRPGGAHKGAET